MIAAPGQPSSYTPDGAPLILYGFQLADGRRGGFCWTGKPRCVHPSPDGSSHALRLREPVLTEAIGTCRSCGTRVYARRFPDDLLLVVEITDALVRRMASAPLHPLEHLSILRCVLPGVEIDLSRGIESPDHPANLEDA